MGDFNFCYDEFEPNCQNMFKQLWKEKDFTNVTLAASDDVSFNVHKVILSASSSLFRRIFQNNPHQNPLIYFHNIKSENLELLLQFIYLGQCKVNQDNLLGFLEAGKQLQIKGLAVKEKGSGSKEKLKEEIVADKNDCENDITNEYVDSMITTGDTELTINEKSSLDQLAISDKPFVFTFDMTLEKSAPRFLKEFEYNGDIFVKNDSSQFSCKKCTAKFSSSMKILRHIQAKHDKIKHSCELCDFQSTYPRVLSDHVLAIHQGRKFKCDHCEFEASASPTLTFHANAHHKGLTFDCEHCDFKAKFDRVLRRHIKANHSKGQAGYKVVAENNDLKSENI